MTPRSPRVKRVNRPLVEVLEDRCLPSAAPDVFPMVVSNDTYYTNGSLWGMYGDETSPANKFGSQAGEAWAADYVGSDNVYVAVIDEGIDFNHPDLAGNIWTNPYDPVDGLDNDGNGYTDDIHGWDFFQDNNSIYDGTSGSGIDAHGTHVAGTIGATGGNGAGVVGVNWNVTIISAKFLGPNGGYISDAVDAVKYVTNLKRLHPEMNIVAMNNSWGGGGYSSALHNAIIDAGREGILFVAAAGNSGTNNDRRASYPSNYSTQAALGYETVIAVAAIDKNGNKPSWSSYGKTNVDLGAPGVSIVSTVPGGYASYSGTSMATPHVTGAAALYASVNPGMSASQIRSAVLSNTEYTKSMANKTATNGRLNIAKMLGLDAGTVVPTGSTGSSGTSGSGGGGGQAQRQDIDDAGITDEDIAAMEVSPDAVITVIIVQPPTTFAPPVNVIHNVQTITPVAPPARSALGWGTSTLMATENTAGTKILIVPAPRIDAPRPVTPPAIPADEQPGLPQEPALTPPVIVSLPATEYVDASQEPTIDPSDAASDGSASLFGVAFLVGGLGVSPRPDEKRRFRKTERRFNA